MDEIEGFVAGAGTDDVIDLIAVLSMSSFADVLSAAQDDGVDTTIQFSASNSLILRDVLESQLHEDDFIFA